ncbi:hypothetical protein JNK13_01510 [bacterium]|nr:hypothetical protein [bacterium]
MAVTSIFGHAHWPNISSEILGPNLEKAYACLLGVSPSGGFGDGGIDVPFPSQIAREFGARGFQVKSSFEGAKDFLAKMVKFQRFTFIAIGEPPQTAQELIKSFIEYGGWVGSEVGGRREILQGIAVVQNTIAAMQKGGRYIMQ